MSQPIALVTGATEGIGRATALALAEAGYAVGVAARTAAQVESLVAELGRVGVKAAGRAADVGDPGQVEALVAHVIRELGPIDTLINNAGVLIPKALLDTSLEEWDATFATNVRGLFLTTRAILPAMIERGRGDIVNLASLAGKNPVPNATAYSASKHAVLGFSRSLLLEVRKHGIRVIAICPGSVDTPMMRGQSTLRREFDRILHPEDVAQTIVGALRLPRRATVSELDVRPANP